MVWLKISVSATQCFPLALRHCLLKKRETCSITTCRRKLKWSLHSIQDDAVHRPQNYAKTNKGFNIFLVQTSLLWCMEAQSIDQRKQTSRNYNLPGHMEPCKCNYAIVTSFLHQLNGKHRMIATPHCEEVDDWNICQLVVREIVVPSHEKWSNIKTKWTERLIDRPLLKWES